MVSLLTNSAIKQLLISLFVLALSFYLFATKSLTTNAPSQQSQPQDQDMSIASSVPTTPSQWRAALAALPSLEETKGKIPAFFFGHGSPGIIWPKHIQRGMDMGRVQGGTDALLPQFLKDFGKTLLEKYKPKAIVVFSAHWETKGERLVTDYGDENPLLYDYFGFPEELYDVKYKSRGDTSISQHVVELFRKAGFKARTTPISESRGRDGSHKPRLADSGLDHGVFVPFLYMFPNPQIPIIQASIDSSLKPEDEWKIGKSVAALRDEGILILSGGLTVHTFYDFDAFNPDKAKPMYYEFLGELHKAAVEPDPKLRKEKLIALTGHPVFRKAHPREDHFVPLYVAAGAGEEGKSSLLEGMYGTGTIAFGLP